MRSKRLTIRDPFLGPLAHAESTAVEGVALELDHVDRRDIVAASRQRRSTQAPRIAVGPTPPPGFVRMPLSDYLEG